jgi:hypothetical protein
VDVYELVSDPAHERGRAVLKPENKTYPAIHPKGALEIFGVVVGQFREKGDRFIFHSFVWPPC